MTQSRFIPLARALAISSLTGAALLAGSLGPVVAQTATVPSANTPPAAAAAISTKPETLDQRISCLLYTSPSPRD